MSEITELVVFLLDEQRYAVPLELVDRVVRAAEVTPLPNALPIVHGVIDVGGELMPVLNLRRRLGLPDRAIGPGDQFLLGRTAQRAVALVIDEVQGIVERAPDQIVGADRIAPGTAHIDGVARLADGLVLIHNLAGFLSLDEARVLDTALARGAPS